ncbi:MAG: metalloregulator ArsR/SmtB family transcription factor [Thermoanaerobaculia bacterium]
MRLRGLAALASQHRALGNPMRLRIVALLSHEPLFVCQMAAILRLSLSTLSTHLAALRSAGLVTESREGKWIQYAVTDVGAERWESQRAALAGDRDLEADAAVLLVARRIPREELCAAGLDYRKLRHPDLIAVARVYGRLGRGRIPTAGGESSSTCATSASGCRSGNADHD